MGQWASAFFRFESRSDDQITFSITSRTEFPSHRSTALAVDKFNHAGEAYRATGLPCGAVRYRIQCGLPRSGHTIDKWSQAASALAQSAILVGYSEQLKPYRCELSSK